MIRILVALIAALVVHELGHVIAGRLVGFRFGLIAVGPVCLRRSGNGLSLRWEALRQELVGAGRSAAAMSTEIPRSSQNPLRL